MIEVLLHKFCAIFTYQQVTMHTRQNNTMHTYSFSYVYERKQCTGEKKTPCPPPASHPMLQKCWANWRLPKCQTARIYLSAIGSVFSSLSLNGNNHQETLSPRCLWYRYNIVPVFIFCFCKYCWNSSNNGDCDEAQKSDETPPRPPHCLL